MCNGYASPALIHMAQMHLVLRNFVIALLASVGISAGCTPTPPEKAKTEATSAIAYATVQPQRKTMVRKVRQPGQIEPLQEAPLYAKMPGYVRRFLVDIGDLVKGPYYDKEGQLIRRGQLLAEISIPELAEELAQKRAAVDQAKAEVAQARAAVKVARAAVTLAEQQYEQSLANADRAAADLSKWQSEYERVVKLAEAKAINSQLVEEEQNRLRASKAGLRDALAGKQAAAAMIEQVRAAVEKAEADEAAAKARQEVAEADHARTQALTEYQRIEAPFDGVVSRRNIDVGHFVQPAEKAQARPLYTVVQTDVVRVFIDVPEADATLVDRGDEAVVRVPALGERSFSGSVARTSWTLDAATRTLRTEVDLPNAAGELRPGMYVNATIVLEQHDSALTLPLSAVRKDDAKTTCFCIEDGKLVKKTITLGLSDGNEVEVTSGLAADAVVVEKATGELKEGQPVIFPFSAKALKFSQPINSEDTVISIYLAAASAASWATEAFTSAPCSVRRCSLLAAHRCTLAARRRGLKHLPLSQKPAMQRPR